MSEINSIHEQSSLSIENFTQSQSHGLYWDNEIRVNVFNVSQCVNDTIKYDIPCENNKFNSNENISIKTSGNNNIDCGDIIRFYETEPSNKVTIILIRYKQIGEQKKIYEILELDYNEKLRKILFGDIPKAVLYGYVNFIKSIENGVVSDEIKKQYKVCKQKMQKEYNMYINISPKVDSKNQRRVQCSIPKIDELLEAYPEFIISRNTEAIIRGVQITSTIESGKRKRNPKQSTL